MVLSYKTLTSYYKELIEMKHHGGYSIADLNNMIPWELDIYEIIHSNVLKEEGRRNNGV